VTQPWRFIMGCAGLGNLAMAYSYRMKEESDNKKLKQTILNGLVHMQKVVKPFYEGKVSYYDYYSFERVAVFYGILTVNGVDWHHVMSDKIMEQQRLCGKFNILKTEETHSKTYDLCGQAFALLFLKKGTKKIYASVVD